MTRWQFLFRTPRHKRSLDLILAENRCALHKEWWGAYDCTDPKCMVYHKRGRSAA